MNNTKYLETVEDTVTMNPQVFTALMRKFRHHRNVRYQFSHKHTQDILGYRKGQGLAKNENNMPANVYGIPVTYDCDITGVL